MPTTAGLSAGADRASRVPDYVKHIRLAVNAFDLDRVPPEMIRKFFFDPDGTPRLDLKAAVEVELDRIEPTRAFVFTCDLLTAALVVDLLKSECRRTKSDLVQGYIRRKESWARILNNEVLTAVDPDTGKTVLSPKTFPPPGSKAGKKAEEPPAPLEGKAPERIIFGKK